MRKVPLVVFFCAFVIFAGVSAFAGESETELKKYLSDMNKIVIEVDTTMRNMTMKIFTAGIAKEQMDKEIEKFKVLKAPSIFLKDHNDMLSAFTKIRDGLKLLSEQEREKSVELVREGTALLKDAAINMRTTAEGEGLIPLKPKAAEAAKPILPSQAPSVIAGTSPTPSPHIATPSVSVQTIDMTPPASGDTSQISVPSMPKQVGMPGVTPAYNTPQPPILESAVGEVINKGREKNGLPWIQVKDIFFDRLIKIKIKNLEGTPIVKKAVVMHFEDIKTGDTISVIYRNDSEGNTANFISILTEEEKDRIMGQNLRKPPLPRR